jgi:hypothetical protein
MSGCMVVSGWSSSTMPIAPITCARRVAQRNAAHEEGAAWLVSRSTRIGWPLSITCAISVFGHDLLDAAADEVRLLVAQRRQEALVALADPDDAVARGRPTIMPIACGRRSSNMLARRA